MYRNYYDRIVQVREQFNDTEKHTVHEELHIIFYQRSYVIGITKYSNECLDVRPKLKDIP